MSKHYKDTGNDGGPAFPVPDGHGDLIGSKFGGVTPWPMGASRRDYFAAAALAGGLEQGVEHDMAAINPDRPGWWHSPDKIAERAFAIADAMLRASRVNL